MASDRFSDSRFFAWYHEHEYDLMVGRYLDSVARDRKNIDRFLCMLDLTTVESVFERPDAPRIYTIQYDEHALAESYALHHAYAGIPSLAREYVDEYRAFGLELLVSRPLCVAQTFNCWRADKALARAHPALELPYSIKRVDEHGLISAWRPNSEAGIVFDAFSEEAIQEFYPEYLRTSRLLN